MACSAFIVRLCKEAIETATVRVSSSKVVPTRPAKSRNHVAKLDGCKQAWLLKKSFAEKGSKKLFVRMPYKRLSRFSSYFVSPKFWLFGWKMEFFNSHRRFCSLTRK